MVKPDELMLGFVANPSPSSNFIFIKLVAQVFVFKKLHSTSVVYTARGNTHRCARHGDVPTVTHLVLLL